MKIGLATKQSFHRTNYVIVEHRIGLSVIEISPLFPLLHLYLLVVNVSFTYAHLTVLLCVYFYTRAAAMFVVLCVFRAENPLTSSPSPLYANGLVEFTQTICGFDSQLRRRYFAISQGCFCCLCRCVHHNRTNISVVFVFLNLAAQEFCCIQSPYHHH